MAEQDTVCVRLGSDWVEDVWDESAGEQKLENAVGVVLPDGKFKTIVVDPPWKYGKWGKGSRKCKMSLHEKNIDTPLPYASMSISEICDLPVSKSADVNCDLYLWTTQKYLPKAFDVLNKWGFRYCQTLIWCKTPMGIGQGGLFCPTNEFILIGRIGKSPSNKNRINSTWWNIKRTKVHSKKPEFFQDLIEKVSDPPRLELFARRKRDGWTVWGNEV